MYLENLISLSLINQRGLALCQICFPIRNLVLISMNIHISGDVLKWASTIFTNSRVNVEPASKNMPES